MMQRPSFKLEARTIIMGRSAAEFLVLGTVRPTPAMASFGRSKAQRSNLD
jgi:hypothetical protein